MPAKKKYGEIESFDPDWLEKVDWTDPEQAKAAAKKHAEEWADDANTKLHNLHSGLTQTQQTLAGWEKFREANSHILNRWDDVDKVVRKHEGVDGLLAQLNQQDSREQIQEEAKQVAAAVQQGDLDWELQGKPLLQRLAQREQALNSAMDWIQTGREKDLEAIKDQVLQIQRANQQQLANIFNPMLQVMDRFAAKDGKKPTDVLRAMAERNITDPEEAWKSLYGEEEMRAQISQELKEQYDKEYEAKAEELRRTTEQSNFNNAMEGGVSPTSVGVFKRKERPDLTNPQERMKQTLKRLGVNS
jgi:hypothetical protein